MKIRSMLLLLAVLLLTGSAVPAHAAGNSGPPEPADRAAANVNDKLETLEGLAAGFYLASVESNRQLAYAYVTKLKAMARLPELRAIGEPAGWERIDQLLAASARALNRNVSAGEWREEAARLKLAVDALAPGRHSLWLQYELLFREDLDRLQKAWARGGTSGAEAASAAMVQLKAHIDRMEAAASVGQSPQRIRLLQERIRYTSTLLAAAERGEANPRLVEGSFVLLADAADRVFETPGRPAAAMVAGEPQTGWMVMLAVIVLSVLTYNGWRKFRHDRDGITVHKRPVA